MALTFVLARRVVLAQSCGRCGNPWCASPPIDVHHILHRHEGGSDDAENLLALCRRCHVAYHAGLFGRRSVVNWKELIQRGEAATTGVQLEGWRKLDGADRKRIWQTLRLGRLGGLMEICSGRYRSDGTAEEIFAFGLPLAEGFRLKRDYGECDAIIARLDASFDEVSLLRGAGFGVRARSRLDLLKARVENARPNPDLALQLYRSSSAAAELDMFPGWQDASVTALAEAMVSHIKHTGRNGTDLVDLSDLKALLGQSGKSLRLTRVAKVNLDGKIAVAEIDSWQGTRDPDAVKSELRPVIAELAKVRYVRGYCLRQINLADQLIARLPSNSVERDAALHEIHGLYVSAWNAATGNGTRPFSEGIIPGQRLHLIRRIDTIEKRYAFRPGRSVGSSFSTSRHP